jgi:hypothetical protein
MSENKNYSGYMPMINQIDISPSMEMINTDGKLIHAHSFVIQTRENKDFVFSIAERDLVRLYFLLHKVLGHAQG